MTKIRQYFYLASGAIAGILPILLFAKLISADQAASITDMIGSLGSLLGAGGALTAGVVLGKQRKDGTLDTAAPADAAIAAIQQTAAAVTTATSELGRVKQAAADVLGGLPIVGPLTQEFLNSGTPGGSR